MKLIEEIKEKTGVDVRDKCRKRDNVYTRTIYYKLLRDNELKSYQSIGDTCNQTHCQVLHSIKNIFPVLMKHSETHRALYYELLGIIDPVILKEKESALQRLRMDTRIRKSLIVELLSEYNFFIKPHHKRRLEDLL